MDIFTLRFLAHLENAKLIGIAKKNSTQLSIKLQDIGSDDKTSLLLKLSIDGLKNVFGQDLNIEKYVQSLFEK